MAKPPKDKVKLPTLKSAASREGIPFYIVPLPACRQAGTLPLRAGPKGGACGALAGQGNGRHGKGSSILSITSFSEPLNGPGDSILIEVSAAANLSDSSTE
jgi:hypothetical protein